MNHLAEELNQALSGTIIDDLLSDFGRRFYFPKGIVSQSAEAKKKATRYNATIGMAYSQGAPIALRTISSELPNLSPAEAVAYAPTQGDAALRELWKTEMGVKNPDLQLSRISDPIVVPGLTNGIMQIADLFLNPGDRVIVPDMYWGNYNLIFTERVGADLQTFPFFNTAKTGLNIDGLSTALRDGGKDTKSLLVLNFPNNPTGYSPTKTEVKQLLEVLKKIADEGKKFIVLCDDAYFGLFYEKETHTQSLFANLAHLHPNILAVKVDGATKENYVWGFRIGFVTFGSPQLSPEHYEAISKKLMGAIRSSISNSSRPAQSILLKSLKSGTYRQEKQDIAAALKERYLKVQEAISSETEDTALEPLPFNSGYFMSFYLKRGSAEELRQLLLSRGIGTISIQDTYLRIAYASVETADIPELYREIFAAAKEITQ